MKRNFFLRKQQFVRRSPRKLPKSADAGAGMQAVASTSGAPGTSDAAGTSGAQATGGHTVTVRGLTYPTFGSSFNARNMDDTRRIQPKRQGGGDVEAQFRTTRQVYT